MKTCICKDKHNKPKKLYKLKSEVDEQIRYIKEARNTILKSYKCPLVPGWHLTSDGIRQHPIGQRSISFVVSSNLKRRHMTGGRFADIWPDKR